MDFGKLLQVASNDVSHQCAWEPQVLQQMLPTRLGLVCLCAINSFPMANFFLQVSFSLIMAWVIIHKHWTSCLFFALFATILTSQAWPYCGTMSKLSCAKKPENRIMLVFLALISRTWVPFNSDHKALHGPAQAKKTLTGKQAFVGWLLHLFFPCFITEKEMTGSCISHIQHVCTRTHLVLTQVFSGYVIAEPHEFIFHEVCGQEMIAFSLL